MINLKNKLTVDDLILEYIIYKVNNGYDTKVSISEFMSFLYLFENNVKVEDVTYDKEILFQRFFERKKAKDWSGSVSSGKKEMYEPHLEIEYDDKLKDYVIKPNYRLSAFDNSIINTYFMNKSDVDIIRKIIEIYLQEQPRRKIDTSVKVDEQNLFIGKYIASEIIVNIWKNYVKEKIENRTWPKQCIDINKYLLEIDLAEIIGLKSIKNYLLKFYNDISKRIAVLYQQDKNLLISNYSNSYLANSNYKVLINGYEELFELAFGKNKGSLEIDLTKLTFKESHELENFYDIETITVLIGNEEEKKLVKNIEMNLK